MLRVGALLVGWLVFSFLVRRFVRPPVLRTGLVENTGNRVVPIPAGTDLSGPQTVLIWCEPFSTPIAAANQMPV